jgi:hypothetical protein
MSILLNRGPLQEPQKVTGELLAEYVIEHLARRGNNQNAIFDAVVTRGVNRGIMCFSPCRQSSIRDYIV